MPNFSIHADPVLTEFIYKEIKERKQGPMKSFRYCWVSVTLGSVIAKFNCNLSHKIFKILCKAFEPVIVEFLFENFAGAVKTATF